MSSPPEIPRLQEFLTRFSDFHREISANELKERKSGFSHLINGFKRRYPAWLEFRKQNAPEFNIFGILNIRHRETKLHTPFLCNLLSPRGTHQQGDLFLKSFLKKMLPEEKQFESFDSHLIQVEEEYYARKKGRIDILIRHLGKENPFLIVIENKLYAGDQEMQLQRYYDFASKHLHFSNDQIRLFYLTIWGHVPTDGFTISNDSRIALEKEKVLRYISYQNSIRHWLEDILPKIEAPVVRETVKQYLNTIQFLSV